MGLGRLVGQRRLLACLGSLNPAGVDPAVEDVRLVEQVDEELPGRRDTVYLELTESTENGPFSLQFVRVPYDVEAELAVAKEMGMPQYRSVRVTGV